MEGPGSGASAAAQGSRGWSRRCGCLPRGRGRFHGSGRLRRQPEQLPRVIRYPVRSDGPTGSRVRRRGRCGRELSGIAVPAGDARAIVASRRRSAWLRGRGGKPGVPERRADAGLPSVRRRSDSGVESGRVVAPPAGSKPRVQEDGDGGGVAPLPALVSERPTDRRGAHARSTRSVPAALSPPSATGGRLEDKAARCGDSRMPGEGVEPSRPVAGHLILSQARIANFATPARIEG